MIELKVQDYCQDCPNFEAEVLKELCMAGTVFEVRCQNHNFCENINRHLKEKYGIERRGF